MKKEIRILIEFDDIECRHTHQVAYEINRNGKRYGSVMMFKDKGQAEEAVAYIAREAFKELQEK